MRHVLLSDSLFSGNNIFYKPLTADNYKYTINENEVVVSGTIKCMSYGGIYGNLTPMNTVEFELGLIIPREFAYEVGYRNGEDGDWLKLTTTLIRAKLEGNKWTILGDDLE
jgi:hypothetical protein